ncbi:hypothetical protein H4582DRAFT_2088753 [Lactarius indigo]|nr:hypothetical protein H4582DRAFT_2088753 [Lactarius indigo]
MASHAPPGHFTPDSDTVPDLNDEDEDEFAQRPRYRSKPPLRSRPPINFSGRRSTVDTDHDFDYSGTTFGPSRSHMSGSTLRSGLNRSTAPRKSSRSISPDVIAALTDAELLHNPLYRELRQDHFRMSSVLAKYAERDLAGFGTAKSESPMYQVVPRGVSSCRADSHGPDSRTSSLGPSDSASQPAKFDITTDKIIEELLESVEAPLVHPRCLPESVLWDFEDCAKDKSGPPIVTKSNQSRPKLSLALRRPNGNTISNLEQSNIRRSAEIIVQRLINLVNSDPRSAVRSGGSKSWTKTLVKKFFAAEYDQAILDLEAEQKLLRLCSAHWKADAVVTQVFLRRNEVEARAGGAMGSARAASPHSNLSDNLSLLAPTAFIPRIQDAAPMNAAKRALELSPGPKSPSASHAQKRSKDGILVSRQKIVGTKGLLNESQRPAARKITPTFLSRTEMVRAEPAPTRLHLLHVDPSADNLIAILTSDFPSLTNGPQLLRSMNAQSSFKQSEPSEQVTTLLNRIQFADPSSPDIDEDNACQGWGHEQFTAGGITLSSSLTSWQEVGNVATALKLVAAAIKTCQEARLMCENAGILKTNAFISDIYLEKTLECLESCWVGAGGALTSQNRIPPIPTTPSYRDVAMSPPPRGPTIKIKRPVPVTNVAASNTPEVPTGAVLRFGLVRLRTLTVPVATTAVR